MEHEYWLNYLVDYMGSEFQDEYPGFYDYLKDDDRQNEFVPLMVYTLPSPRIDYYSYENYQIIQDGVLEQTHQVIDMLGQYPVQGHYYLLQDMEIAQLAVLLIGLVFNIMLIMFIIISVLLIYSLLSITIQTKTFEFGVMRLVGLSKTGFVVMIMI